ncbi:gpW family head-tail joining protein [uncultured Azohydromonas sp.]|jgi:gpW.|uniref:phage head-tail joining protein n=1 Tax=uncultured Azohydromonas sp. TaxID=487342 RepID=UPI00261C876D|nr:gpW family head-tail joining protein [uncultured Azohydromonas sp.]
MATLQEQLAEAEAARHKLLTGTARVSFRHGDRQVEYSKTDLAALESYIAELRRRIAGRMPLRRRISYVVPY